jgi:hypothetical protein
MMLLPPTAAGDPKLYEGSGEVIFAISSITKGPATEGADPSVHDTAADEMSR